MTSLSILELKNKLEALTLPKLQKETEKLILEERNIVFQKQDELELGQRPDGSIIGQYRSEDYRLLKMQINPLAGGNVDLILTGATRDALNIKAVGNGRFLIKSNNWKWPQLMEKYAIGGDLETINKRAFTDIQRNDVSPKLIKKLKDITGIR